MGRSFKSMNSQITHCLLRVNPPTTATPLQAVVHQSEQLKERMGTSDYRVVLLIDRRGANVFNQDIELYKAFFKVSGWSVA